MARNGLSARRQQVELPALFTDVRATIPAAHVSIDITVPQSESPRNSPGCSDEYS
jgi:hypothetical protein